MSQGIRPIVSTVLGVAAIAVAARVTVPIPGTSVPQSAQTLAVVLVGAAFGARGGAWTLAAYLAVGGIGAPVFADGAAGWEHLVGPTAGYLLGFLGAAWGVGRMGDLGLLRRIGPAVGVMLGAHAAILALGWARLSLELGPAPAFDAGVAPFVLGGVVKAAAAALTVVGIVALRKRRSGGAMDGEEAGQHQEGGDSWER